MKKIIILDRDGVINKDSINYIKSVNEFEFLPGSLQAIKRLTESGYHIGIATNQSAIGRGLITRETLEEIHSYMLEQIKSVGGTIDTIEFCPHVPEEKCFCRKPQPGMLHKILKTLNNNHQNVMFLGDKLSDLLAAEAANLKPVLIVSPQSELKIIRQKFPDISTFASLEQFVKEIL